MKVSIECVYILSVQYSIDGTQNDERHVTINELEEEKFEEEEDEEAEQEVK